MKTTLAKLDVDVEHENKDRELVQGGMNSNRVTNAAKVNSSKPAHKIQKKIISKGDNPKSGDTTLFRGNVQIRAIVKMRLVEGGSSVDCRFLACMLPEKEIQQRVTRLTPM